MSMNIKGNLKRFLKGFTYAFSGIIYCIKTERNMRFHLCAAFYVILFMGFYEFTRCEKMVIFLTISAVISLELVNSAIERCIDLISLKYDPLAKKAKDAAAGAVLCSAVFSVIIGVVLFWDPKVFSEIFKYFAGNSAALTGIIISAVLWFIFIFSVQAEKKFIDNNDKDIKNE
ncbi:diacylglycerol kinase family protein [Hominimerdicola sp. 21CYCFAH17_S]